MSESTTPGGPTKFAAARDAARAFLSNLVAGRDQAAVIQFNPTALVVVSLTDDPAVASAGLDRLTQASGTRIDLALEIARAELTGPRRRAGNNPVLVLLTDGEPTGTTREEVLARAGEAKAAGLLVFTIGLGEQVDHDLMRAIATQPDWYFAAPDTSDLASIYDRIAYSIPCKPPWP
jgi:Mg-chelatase subunit ChlD